MRGERIGGVDACRRLELFPRAGHVADGRVRDSRLVVDRGIPGVEGQGSLVGGYRGGGPIQRAQRIAQPREGQRVTRIELGRSREVLERLLRLPASQEREPQIPANRG